MAAKIAVLGAGSWGTAIAQAQALRGHTVQLWDLFTSHLETIRTDHVNQKFHPGRRLSERILPEPDLEKATQDAELVFLVVPSHAVRSVLTRAMSTSPKNAIFVCAAKGLELKTPKLLSSVASDILGKKEARKRYAVLSGPTFAAEVVQDLPTAMTVACETLQTAKMVQEQCHTERFQIFVSDDVIGVEIAGALKNVVAIAAGASDRLGFGHNARASLITRALAEISRIGREMGANPLTFAGLSGLGDLLLTCTGDLSRNRRVGMKLAEGKSIHQIMREIGQVAEGIRTTKAAYRLAQKLNVDVPILREMYLSLYEKKDPRQAVQAILSIAPGEERD